MYRAADNVRIINQDFSATANLSIDVSNPLFFVSKLKIFAFVLLSSLGGKTIKRFP